MSFCFSYGYFRLERRVDVKSGKIFSCQAFIFIMLTILGNSDVSVIYTVAPLLGVANWWILWGL